MMVNIDSVLKPYEDSQPQRVSLPSGKIHRFPPLADGNGINPQFSEFYNTLVSVLTDENFWDTENLYKLYEISDKAVDFEDFADLLCTNWLKHLENFLSVSESNRGMDVEINMDRFQSLHRNIVGGINVMTYHLNIRDDEFSDKQLTNFVQASAELLFVYDGNRFRLVTNFSVFRLSE